MDTYVINNQIKLPRVGLLLLWALIALWDDSATGEVHHVSSPNQDGRNSRATSIAGSIGPKGEALLLRGYASIKFPPNTFKSLTTVRIQTTADPRTNESYEASTAIFKTSQRSSYEVRVTTSALPQGDINLVLPVPKDLAAQKRSKNSIELLAQLYEENDLEILDVFEVMPSKFDHKAQTVSATIPNVVFTDKRHPNIFEAIFILSIIQVQDRPQ